VSNVLSARSWFDAGGARKELARGASLVRQHAIFEARGHLTVGEMGKGLPFVPRRFFVISEVPAEDIRGEHAHRELHQFLLCLAGSVVVEVDDGERQAAVRLDCPHAGVHLEPMVWASQHTYTRDAVLLVLASAEYDAADYIRVHEEFIALARARPR
jgi:UDP-2-acetamido-3-amino-2,3-dideoxy-glucuronate N-acetyltransferase